VAPPHGPPDEEATVEDDEDGWPEEETTMEDEPGNNDDDDSTRDDAKDADDDDDTDNDDERPNELPWEDPALALVTPVLDTCRDDPLAAPLEVPAALVVLDADEDTPADDAALLPCEEATRLLDTRPDAEVAPLVVPTPDELPRD